MSNRIRVVSCLTCKHFTDSICRKHFKPNVTALNVRNDDSKCDLTGKDYEHIIDEKFYSINIMINLYLAIYTFPHYTTIPFGFLGWYFTKYLNSNKVQYSELFWNNDNKLTYIHKN